jgi:hypothetical protein
MSFKRPYPSAHNEVLHIPGPEGAYVSYVASGKKSALVEMMDTLMGVSEDVGETALCIPNGKAGGLTAFLILSGDWRAAYTESHLGGLGACIEVFKKNVAENRFTTSDSVSDLVDDVTTSN